MANDRTLRRRDFIRVAAVTALGVAAGCSDSASERAPEPAGAPDGDSGAEAETDLGTETESGSGTETESSTETGSGSGTEADPDSETDTTPPTDCELTGSDIEGPFYRDNPPNRAVLVDAQEPGRALKIVGTVYAADCVTPLVGAVVDVWHADDAGEYDNSSDAFRMRGQMQTDEAGLYLFETIRPGRYPNGGTFRPEHIHYKVSYKTADADEVALTTQLYFEGDPYLEADPWATPARTIPLTEESAATFVGRFDVVLPVQLG